MRDQGHTSVQFDLGGADDSCWCRISILSWGATNSKLVRTELSGAEQNWALKLGLTVAKAQVYVLMSPGTFGGKASVPSPMSTVAGMVVKWTSTWLRSSVSVLMSPGAFGGEVSVPIPVSYGRSERCSRDMNSGIETGSSADWFMLIKAKTWVMACHCSVSGVDYSERHLWSVLENHSKFLQSAISVVWKRKVFWFWQLSAVYRKLYPFIGSVLVIYRPYRGRK